MPHGLRSNKSTHTTIICITQQIMDGFNQIDTLSKGTTKLKTGLFCLDLKGAVDAIRSEVVLDNLIRLGARPKYMLIFRQRLARRGLVARSRYDASMVFREGQGCRKGVSSRHFYSRSY